MRLLSGLLGFLLALNASASFYQDVAVESRNLRPSNLIRKLVESAVLPDDRSSRRLEDQQQQNQDQYSFNGYSLKYAKCQPIQQFSEEALLSGEYSPMVTDDIVVLRLCPSDSCSSSSEYGCYYNYAEYAIKLTDYVRIMLEIKQGQAQTLCQFCQDCMQGGDERRLQDEDNQQGEGVNGNAEEGGDAQDEGAQDGDAQEGDQQAADGDQICDYWDTYCSSYNGMCGQQFYEDADANNDAGGEQENQYVRGGMVDYEQIVNLVDCGQVQYNDYAYFIRPTCDASSGQIKMAVYYDNYCIQYAGNDVNVQNLGLGLKDGFFKDMYQSECMMCGDNEYLPYDDESASALCNNLHQESAMCTADLMYDLFENDADHSLECKLIEDIRFEKYGENGIIGGASAWASWNQEVTPSQKTMIIVTSCLCLFLIFYACYLHHSMTNLLIKSLSHHELLPRRGKSRRRAKTPRPEKGADDWD